MSDAGTTGNQRQKRMKPYAKVMAISLLVIATGLLTAAGSARADRYDALRNDERLHNGLLAVTIGRHIERIPDGGSAIDREVAEMEQVQVDHVHPESTEARLARPDDVLRRVVDVNLFPGLLVEPLPKLRRNDGPVPLPGERLPEDPLASPRAVDVGGVEEGDPEVERPPNGALRLLGRFGDQPRLVVPGSRIAEAPDPCRAQTEGADFDSASTENPPHIDRLLTPGFAAGEGPGTS